MQSNVEFPAKLQCLFEPHRYKILHGGRGGAKSWGVGRALLIKGAASPLRIPCAREIQKSIADSVHALLKNQVKEMGLDGFYKVRETYIEGKNGTEFSFHGLKHNIANIKSLEGADICWVEEAQTVSKSSWDTLIPTIRKDGSEIWASLNPELATDETYKRFILNPPANAKVVKIDWRDNPWFPDVLRQEKDDLKARDYDAYLNVWEGATRQTLDGAIYANEIRQATLDGRITRVPHDPTKDVLCFWDLGRADMTAIWFVQVVGMSFAIIDYYENRGHGLPHYLKVLKEKPYRYGCQWLPHDSEEKRLGQAKTILEQVLEAGLKADVVPKLRVVEGINAARTIFARCYFDEEKCADGINGLRHYRYEVDPHTREVSSQPMHDWASHPADAWRYFAVGIQDRKPKKPAKAREARAGGWMG